MKRYMVTLGIEVNDEDADDLIRQAKEMYHNPAADFDLDREEFVDWEEFVKDMHGGDPVEAALEILVVPCGELDDGLIIESCKVNIAFSQIDQATEWPLELSVIDEANEDRRKS